MSSVVSLVPVDSSILSSYATAGGTSGPRTGLTPLYKLGKAGVCVAEVGVALKKFNDACLAAGADFRITELHRDYATQAAARKKYNTWVSAGKPTGAAFDSKTMKSAFVALPGRSGHNAGRSIDVNTATMKFPNVAANLQLDKLWEIAKPFGWTPIIRAATEGASESWHFDYQGELKGVMARLGYEQWALCGALLVGHGDMQGYDAVLQALLCRAGFDIGKIDGDVGQKTLTALKTALPAVDPVLAFKSKDESIFARLLTLTAK